MLFPEFILSLLLELPFIGTIGISLPSEIAAALYDFRNRNKRVKIVNKLSDLLKNISGL